MANTDVALTTLTAGTLSADILTTAEGGTSVASGDTAVIDVQGDMRGVFFTFKNTSASTATVTAGDSPPALRAGLGATSALSIPAGDCLLLTVEGARFCHDDGKVRITIGSNATIVGAYRLPRTV